MDAPSQSSGPAVCARCRHFRRAPWQARRTGCWLPANMVSKQDAAYLDQQQTPGDHEKINLRGDCSDFAPLPAKPSLWQRLTTLPV